MLSGVARARVVNAYSLKTSLQIYPHHTRTLFLGISNASTKMQDHFVDLISQRPTGPSLPMLPETSPPALYTALQEEDEIRLLHLNPGTESIPITCPVLAGPLGFQGRFAKRASVLRQA